VNTSNEPILKKQPKPIYNITSFTLLDYPDKTACILWFAGCNMRCLYCYNPDIVLGKGKISFDAVYDFLKSRKGLLDGVVLSGGECLIHKNIINFVKKIKHLGFNVKVDTNGSNHIILSQLLNNKLIDYVALDFKALASEFKRITKSKLFEPFEKSLALLINSDVKFEIRTTVHSDLIAEDDFIRMIAYLENQHYKGNYYVQHFVNEVETLEKLGYSNKNWSTKNFDTENIKVIFR